MVEKDDCFVFRMSGFEWRSLRPPFSLLITGRRRQALPVGPGGVDIGGHSCLDDQGSIRGTAPLSRSPIECLGGEPPRGE
ncbi:unnamed protein product [Gadus morhua 'NCC']